MWLGIPGSHEEPFPKSWIQPTRHPLASTRAPFFYIGGTVEVQLHCHLSCAVECVAISAALLDEYTDQTTPGKFWTEYKSTSNDTGDIMPVAADAAGLQDKLNHLLQSSTTKKFLRSQKKSNGSHYCPHLRLKEKRLDLKWLADEHMHNGSHAPLCVYTNNASARSMDAELRRAAAMGKGKGGRVTYAPVARRQRRNAAQSGKGKSSQEDAGSVSSQWQDVSSSISSSSVQYRHSGGRDSNDRPRSIARDNDQFQGVGSWPYPDLIQGNHLGFQMLSTARPNTTPPGLN